MEEITSRAFPRNPQQPTLGQIGNQEVKKNTDTKIFFLKAWHDNLKSELFEHISQALEQ